MNSLPDNRLEETLDQLLAASVSPGSEPEGFQIGPMPHRPEFPWMQLVYALTGVSIFGFIFMDWLFSQNMAELDFMHLFSLDGVTSLFAGISSGTLATLLGLAAAAVLILPEKLKLLSHTVLNS
jgi:hypothetical protein